MVEILDIFHKDYDFVGKEVLYKQHYLDLHIPKRFQEQIYFLLGYSYKNWEIIFEVGPILIWFRDHCLGLFW